ncbi:MAG: nucleotide exchange factor GrpE [Vicinamibacterales bacterium]
MDDKDKQEPQVRVVDRRWWARGNAEPGAVEEPSGRKPTYVEDLERQLSDAKNRIQELMTGHRRSLEEFEQVKIRLRRDVAREVERGRRVVLAELLEVVDNLDRAVSAAVDGAPAASDQLGRGVALVRDQFLAKLEGFGVKRVPAVGLPFNAQQHEAVTTTAVPAEQDGLVVAVVKEGYAIGEDILRPAAVVVGKH